MTRLRVPDGPPAIVGEEHLGRREQRPVGGGEPFSDWSDPRSAGALLIFSPPAAVFAINAATFVCRIARQPGAGRSRAGRHHSGRSQPGPIKQMAGRVCRISSSHDQ